MSDERFQTSDIRYDIPRPIGVTEPI